MSKLCPKCNYVGKGKFHSLSSFFIANIYFGALIIAIGLSYVFRAPISTLEGTLGRIFGFPLIIFGVYNIMNYFSKGKTCPKCSYKEMLPLDDPKALELIKKYDLKPGENPKTQSSLEHDLDPFETPKS